MIWNKEEVFFQSKTVEKYLGDQFIASPEGMDVLLEVIKSAANYGISTYAWHENGLKVPIKSENGDYYKLGKLLEDKGWLTTNAQGELHGKCEFGVCKGYLNPLHPEVRAFFVEYVAEIVKYYGVKGFMVDDHFSMHPDFGYDPMTLKTYKRYLADKKLDDTPKNFRDFRSNSIITLIRDMKRVANARGKTFILSPGGDPKWSKDNWLQDWEQLVWTMSVDEIIMQAYRYNLMSYLNLVNDPKIDQLSSIVPFGMAILLGLKDNKRSSGRLIFDQTRATLKKGYEVSFFYYDTIDTPAKELENDMQRSIWIRKTSQLLQKVWNK